MKNRTLLVLIAFISTVFTSSLLAQSISGDAADFTLKPTFGLKIGANLSNVYDTQGDEFQADSKFGLAAGLFLAIPIGQYLGIQPELLFSQKGYRASGSILGSDYSSKRTTNFIDVPLFLAFKPTPQFTLLVGPQYSYLLSQNYTYKSELINISRDEQFDNENLGKNILSLAGGFDVNLSNVVLSARTGWDILNNNGDGTSTTPRYKNMWYQATVGFRF